MGTLIAEKRHTEGRHAPPLPRRLLRGLGTTLVVAGALALAWAIVVWRWQDPFTAIYTHVQQGRLTHTYEQRVSRYRPASRDTRVPAAAYRRSLRIGDPVGRLRIPRLGLNMIVVQGTDDATLRKGPGHYAGSALPGENKLIYIAGHRTTYLAPFSHIERMQAGDSITFALPYGTFRYRVVRRYVVAADDVGVLRNKGRELLRLQACHPRFFATERYIVDARPVGAPRSGRLGVSKSSARAGTGSAG